jgi:D-alanine-D-alanine ligase
LKKLRVGIIYGGRSGEHEVSVVSAASIFKHLDRTRYDAVPVVIEKSGRWVLGGRAPEVLSAGAVGKTPSSEALQPTEPSAAVAGSGFDVVFPVLHGPYGEDGTVQGLLELANIPYVGAGVLGSAVGMDKAVMKTLFAAAGLPIVPHLTVFRREWAKDAASISRRAADHLRFPMFVKPANLGSSVGISKAATPSELPAAMELAFQFDRKAVIEAAVPNTREIECAVLGNDEPEASVPGEVIVTHRDGFYSYDAKYLDPEGASLKIPADIPAATAERVRRVSVDAFRALELSGMARVDFLLDGAAGSLYLNEVNTIPGFTAISMYPRMWEASGLPYPALLDRLIALALERHEEKQRLRTSIK